LSLDKLYLGGAEFADEIGNKGKKMTLVELLPCCLKLNFDEDFCALTEEELKRKGVEIITNTRVTKIEDSGKVESVNFSTRQEIQQVYVYKCNRLQK